MRREQTNERATLLIASPSLASVTATKVSTSSILSSINICEKSQEEVRRRNCCRKGEGRER